jgi:hypothetical protein
LQPKFIAFVLWRKEGMRSAIESFFVSFFDGQKKKKHRLLMQGFLMIYDKHLAFILWKKL